MEDVYEHLFGCSLTGELITLVGYGVFKDETLVRFYDNEDWSGNSKLFACQYAGQMSRSSKVIHRVKKIRVHVHIRDFEGE